MLHYYLLHAPCLYLWYSTIFYCPTVYTYGTLLPSTGSLSIPMVLFYLLLAPFLSLWYFTTFYWSLPISLELYYLLLDPCLYLCYSTIFYWIPAVTYDTLLPSSGSLNILMVIYYLLLANCLSLWYSITFYWPTSYSTIVYWLHAYPYLTRLSSSGSLPIPMVLYHLLLDHCLSL